MITRMPTLFRAKFKPSVCMKQSEAFIASLNPKPYFARFTANLYRKKDDRQMGDMLPGSVEIMKGNVAN